MIGWLVGWCVLVVDVDGVVIVVAVVIHITYTYLKVLV